MRAAPLLNEMMVVHFEGGANQAIKKGNHNVEYNLQDHKIQNRLAEPS